MSTNLPWNGIISGIGALIEKMDFNRKMMSVQTPLNNYYFYLFENFATEIQA
jgi:hypothetical protein